MRSKGVAVSKTGPEGIGRKVLAVALGALAAKLALIAVEQLWTKGLHQDIPSDQEDAIFRRAAWIGLTAAAVGIARELARQLAEPRLEES